MAYKMGVKLKDIRCMDKLGNGRWAGLAGFIAVSDQTLFTFGFVFGRKSRFPLGSKYGFGRMCYRLFRPNFGFGSFDL